MNHVEAEARLSGVKPLSCSSHRQDTRGGGVQKVHDSILIVSLKAYDTGSRLEAEVGPRGSSPSAVFLIGGTRGRGGVQNIHDWTTGNNLGSLEATDCSSRCSFSLKCISSRCMFSF